MSLCTRCRFLPFHELRRCALRGCVHVPSIRKGISAVPGHDIPHSPSLHSITSTQIDPYSHLSNLTPQFDPATFTMDKAKAAVDKFIGRSGQHDTTVHESVAPAVHNETIKPHQHENVLTAVDKEVHQDHYHRTVQPVHDREVLPETHEAKLGSVQHREFDHRDHDSTKRHLVEDQAQFKDQRRVEATTTSQSVSPTIGGVSNVSIGLV